MPLHGAGYLTLRVEHPHEPGWQMLQVRFLGCSCQARNMQQLGASVPCHELSKRLAVPHTMKNVSI